MTSWSALTRSIEFEPFQDGTFAIFNHEYWDSTLLGEVDACLLRTIISSAGGASEEGLVQTAASELDFELDDDFRIYCGEALRQLAHIGLIVAVSKH